MGTTDWNIPLDFYDKHFDLTVNVERYLDGGGLALQLMHAEDGWKECFVTLTVNAPGVLLEDEDRQVIVSHNVATETLDAVIASGFFKSKPDAAVQMNMAEVFVYSLTDKALKWVKGELEAKFAA